MWVEHSFGTENGVQHGPEGVEAHFMSLRDGRPLTLSMQGTQACCLSIVPWVEEHTDSMLTLLDVCHAIHGPAVE